MKTKYEMGDEWVDDDQEDYHLWKSWDSYSPVLYNRYSGCGYPRHPTTNKMSYNQPCQHDSDCPSTGGTCDFDTNQCMCGSSSACDTASNKPYCDNGVCKPCASDAQCPEAQGGTCDVSQGVCKCSTIRACDSFGTHPYCDNSDPENPNCFQCHTDGACHDPYLPYCVDNECVPYKKDKDCNPLGNKCDKNTCYCEHNSIKIDSCDPDRSICYKNNDLGGIPIVDTAKIIQIVPNLYHIARLSGATSALDNVYRIKIPVVNKNEDLIAKMEVATLRNSKIFSLHRKDFILNRLNFSFSSSRRVRIVPSFFYRHLTEMTEKYYFITCK